MSTSPLPPDPYEALGISKDADTEIVKKAHRKLVLKHHPDRIKDPTLVEQGKNEFQKVQQAYELLVDPVRRQRYDDEVKLAQLRRERMMNDREAPLRSMPTYTRTMYAARPSPAPAQPMSRETPMPREPRTEPRYATEERTPDSYFDIPTYDEPVPRSTARKVDSYEKRPSLTKATEKKKEERPKPSGWGSHVGSGMSMKMAFGLKDKANSARLRQMEKEMHDKHAKARDKEERRERDQKHTHSRHSSQVGDYSDGSSDSDTVVANGRQRMTRDRTPPPRAARERSPVSRASRDSRSPVPKARRQPSPEPPRMKRQPSPRPVYHEDLEDSPDEEKWERSHGRAKEYMAEALKSKGGRPELHRTGSDLYWSGEPPRGHRRSDSDSDRQRPSSSHKSARRSVPVEEPRLRPSLPTHTSAPAGVKAAARTVDREPITRSRQNSYDSRSLRRDLDVKMPELKRAGSAPMPSPTASAKRDSMPVRGSTLKHSETHHHDSGYGTSSQPPTPEMRGDSPLREGRARETSTRTYRAEKDSAGEGIRKAREIATDMDGGPLNRFLSPEDAIPMHHRASEERREQRRSTSREPDPRSRSSRSGLPERRPSITRAESSSRFEEQRPRAKLFAERSPDRSGYTRRVDPASVKYSTHRPPVTSKYPTYDDHHSSTGTFHHKHSREGRRPPVSATGY